MVDATKYFPGVVALSALSGYLIDREK